MPLNNYKKREIRQITKKKLKNQITCIKCINNIPSGKRPTKFSK